MDYSLVSIKQEADTSDHRISHAPPPPPVDSRSALGELVCDGGEDGGSRAAKKPRVGSVWFPVDYVTPSSSYNAVASVKQEAAEAVAAEPLSWCPPEIAGNHGGEVSEAVRRSDHRQFWKAGDFESNVDQKCDSSLGGMDHLRVHPKFLHSNATSHKWALGACAELLDNSVDEICNGATYVKVDVLKNEKDGTKMLLVEDDGGGMAPERMRQCMSLGYSAKSKHSNTIGQYGNGFKTSTMRLGADVIVFSRFPGTDASRRQTQTIGMLSYSFLRGTGKQDIVVPMIDYERSGERWKMMARTSGDDWERNLATIIQWSSYSSEADLLQQFNCMRDHGTRVVIYNLWEDDEEQLELDFDSDPYDIQIRGANRNERNIKMAQQYPNSRHYLTYRHSLRSYASILYLRLPPYFRMILRGKDIEHHNLVNDMMFAEHITYRPQIPEGTSTKALPNVFANVTIGFVKDAQYHIDVQGFNVYHKNRLIKPFWRVWNAAGSNGRGIIGVLEANFVEPAHDKQGFERTTVLSRLEARLNVMQKSYWSSNCQRVGYVGSARGGSKVKPKKSSNNNAKSTDHDLQLQKDNDSVERSLQVIKQPMTVALLNDLDIERQRRLFLETNLRAAERKIEEMDKEQTALIDFLELERSQREEEEKILETKLAEANRTINDLLQKVRHLEGMNVSIVKDEK